MNDNTKTITFVAVGVALLGIAWALHPRLTGAAPDAMVGQPLVDEFDPLAATRLEILKYDDDDAVVRRFEVAQVDGVWSIPSHNNYPADAKDHLAEAAAGLLSREILSMATDNPAEHATYDVLDPNPDDPKTGEGTRVTMKDKDGKVLLSLIIGKAVPDKADLHYVRRAGQAPVYTAAIETEKLSTKFEDWIEKDLLKMSTWDIKQIQIRDHSVDEAQGVVFQHGEMSLDYNDTGDPKWKLAKDETFNGQKWVPVKMAPDQELDTAKLDAMKNALDELKIVDVNPKPAGLSADLKAAKSFLDNRRAVASLMARGFFPVPLDEKHVELFSNEGEIRCLMKDGVEYVLRFGEIAGGSTPQKADKGKKGDKEKKNDDKKSETAGLNRFIFVTTEFNPAAIEKPKLEPLPEAKPVAKPEAKPAAKPGAKPEAKKPKEEDLKAERDRIEKDNKRKQDEYQEKLDKGKKHVKELSARFADWYYIIPDDVYQKIHLERKDIVKKKTAKKAGTDHGHGEMPGLKPGDTPTDFEGLKGMVPKSETPEVKPETPAPKPQTPEAKTPEAKPKTPEAKPKTKPAEPVAKPKTPAPKPKP